jgi:hypothetical protein
MTFNILIAENSGRLAIQYMHDARCQALYLLNSKHMLKHMFYLFGCYRELSVCISLYRAVS